ncbi:hypothetical protein [Streptomyces sp. NPDC018059]|uniref:hypothetical protein n=1 Tax=Streptomyces sp. NPDC018059 TaxID=3365041 RepID=UPI0037AEAC88
MRLVTVIPTCPPAGPSSRKAVEDCLCSHFHDLDGGYTISNDGHAPDIQRPPS